MSGIAKTNRLTTLRKNTRAATVSIASAPVSWGIMESVEPPYSRVSAEIAKAGYAGTELGPYGFVPPEAAKLRQELGQTQPGSLLSLRCISVRQQGRTQ